MTEISFDILLFDTRTVDLKKQLGEVTYMGKIGSSVSNYAIKVSKFGAKTDLRTFFGDLKALTDLWAPSLVPISYAGYSKDNKNFYIVSKLFPNGSLQQHIEPKVSPQWTPTSAAITVLGVAHALKIIHQRGVAHGKLSPSKVVFDDKMYPHLIDTWISEGPQDIRYVAPELMAHGKADEQAADIFSFALIYYYCVCGYSPFEGIYQAQIGPYFFSGQRPPIPDNLSNFSKQIISQCWDQDPRQRPTADDLYQRLFEHYTEIVYDASFAEVTKYSKLLAKFPLHCFYSKMGDSGSCIKIAQMLREYEANDASQLYMQLARSAPSTTSMQRPKQYMPMKQPQRMYQNDTPVQQQAQPQIQLQMQPPAMQQQMQQGMGMQMMMQQPQQGQAQPYVLPGQPQTVMVQGKPVMMQPVMMNGQVVMQPVGIQMRETPAPAPVQRSSSGKKRTKKVRAVDNQFQDDEEERYRFEAERIRQENERIKAENERLQMNRMMMEKQQEEERMRMEREDSMRRSNMSTMTSKKFNRQFDDDVFIDTPTVESRDSTTEDSYEPNSNMMFSPVAQGNAYQAKPSTHRREELAQAKKNKSKSSKKTKKPMQSTTDSIFEAAEKGDIPELQRYIEQEGVPVDVHDTFRSTPLHLACENGHDQAVRYLLSKGASVNKCDKWHKTPLHWASQGGFSNMIKVLLEHGADVSIADKWGSIPLQLAAEKDHADAVAILVDAGSPIEHQDNSGKTAMALSKNENIRAMLQSNGAQPRVCFVLP